MTNLLYHNYYYRYREARKQVKINRVDNEEYSQAKNELETMIAEHVNRFPDSDIKRDFNYGEKLTMNHALNHLNTVIDKNDPEYIESSTGETKHQSDIVKEALLYIPKQDYSADI